MMTTISGIVDDAANLGRSRSHRLIGQMRVTLRRARLSVAEQLADDLKRKAAGRTEGCEGMSQIISAVDRIQARALPNEFPTGLDLYQMLARYLAGEQPFLTLDTIGPHALKQFDRRR
jgi:hypothetical protein